MESISDLDKKVYLSRVNQFFGHATGNMAGLWFAAFLIYLVLDANDTPLRTIITWCVMLLVVSLVNLFFEQRFKLVVINEANARSWITRRILSGTLLAVLLGVSPFLLPEGTDIRPYMYLFIILSTVVTVGTLGYVIMPIYYYILDALLLGPIIVYFLFQVDTYSHMMLAIAFAWQIVVLQKAHVVSKTAINSLVLNEKLQHEIHVRQLAEQELERLASTDTLTGIDNRRSGLVVLENQINLSRRNEMIFTICFVDIDGLKKVNDKFGHNEGDNLIMAVSQILSSVRGNLILFAGWQVMNSW